MAGPNFTMARGWIAAALLGALAVLLAFTFWPRQPAPGPTPKPPARATNAPALPGPRTPPAALDRAGFLAATAQAASAFAAGKPAPELGSLIGRQFEVLIPFGCFGPSAEGREDQAYWRYNEAKGSITVGARAQQFGEAPWRGVLDPNRTAEAIEGFWVPRPWITTEDCPQASPAGPRGLASSSRTVGLVALYRADTARTKRRDGRPYEVTRPIGNGHALGPYVLVLSGRITGFPDASAFKCLSNSPDQPPTCVAAVEFGRIAIEVSANHEVLAEWAD
jgi:hypothetical protein